MRTDLKPPAPSQVMAGVAVWSVCKSPLGHIKKTLTSTFVCALSCLSAKLQLSVVGVHFPLGHAH